MRTFDYSKLSNIKIASDIVMLLGRIYEAKGKQMFFLAQKPEELKKLIEIAILQSTESSNAIEGIRTSNTRLIQLLNEKTTPKNRSEQEILGYRDALDFIHKNYKRVNLSVDFILELHSILYQHTASRIGGRLKERDNIIVGKEPTTGKTYVVFKPLNFLETPNALAKICEEYDMATMKESVDPLILIPIFIHDFLCIHPFADGNGRMSRLLTTYLLYKHDFLVGKYISLETKIANSKSYYYHALYESQFDWHKGKEDTEPFIRYLFGTIVAAYRDLEKRIDLISLNVSSFEMVKKAVSSKFGTFNKEDIVELCPNLGVKTIEKHLKTLLDLGEIEKHGASRAIYYTRKK